MNDNILKVAFGGNRMVTSNSLWQYDYGQVLEIKGITLPDVYEVHFAESRSGNSVTVLGGSAGVPIPDSLLEKAGEFYAWIYLHATDDDGETEYQIKIPVRERAKPTHEEPTPVQQSEIERLIALCEEIIEHGGGGGGGSDGFSPVVTVTEITGGYQLSIQDKTHTETFNIMNGLKGDKGDKGDTGEQGIQGERGEKGEQGIQGVAGENGKDGKDGKDGADGQDYILTAQDKNDIAALVDVTAVTPKVAKTSADTVSQLDPNKLYVFPEMASLAVSFATPADSNIVNEYHFRFTSGSTATVLTLPSGVVQPDDFAVEANKVYEVSIVDNYMLAVSWSVGA